MERRILNGACNEYGLSTTPIYNLINQLRPPLSVYWRECSGQQLHTASLRCTVLEQILLWPPRWQWTQAAVFPVKKFQLTREWISSECWRTSTWRWKTGRGGGNSVWIKAGKCPTFIRKYWSWEVWWSFCLCPVSGTASQLNSLP